MSDPQLRSTDRNVVIDVRGLAHMYPDGQQSLYGVDLVVRAGERVALLGPNGAGKTTLVMHLNALLIPQSGAVVINGTPVDKTTAAQTRASVGFVFQDPDDQLFLPTVAQDVAFGPANLGLTPEQVAARVEAALRRVDMLDHRDRPPHHLSMGQRRRVALATVLAMDPDVLILDEPTSNLDPLSRRELAEILADLDITLLMVTHDLPYAMQTCARSVILAEGRVVADAATPVLLADSDLLHQHRLELPYGFVV